MIPEANLKRPKLCLNCKFQLIANLFVLKLVFDTKHSIQFRNRTKDSEWNTIFYQFLSQQIVPCSGISSLRMI